MRLRPALLIAAVVAGVLAVPATAAEWVEERAYVPTAHGEMFVDFVRPRTGKAPVILQVTPYRYLYGDADPTASRGGYYRTRYQAQGYAVAYADLLGTGLSGGCWDYGGKAEAESGAALVEWLGTRPWSNGRVGMIGTSYDGAIQLEIATLAPKHLAAIVPQEPVSSWYEYNYDSAVTHNSNDDTSPDETGYPVGTPDLFDLVLGTTPNTDPSHASPASLQAAANDAASGCDVAEHNTRGHYVQPEYTDFWRERDWALRAGNVRAAVLFQHGWRDMNTKPNNFTRFWLGLRRSPDARAILGQWEHVDVFSGKRQIGLDVSAAEYLDKFYAKHLKGDRRTGIERIPRVLSQGNDNLVRTTLPMTAPQTAFSLAHPATGIGTLGRKGTGNGTFTNSGSETSKAFKSDPTTQRGFASYATEPFRKDTRLAGSGSVTLRLTCSLPRGQVAATLLDLGPESTAAKVVTLGLLDLRFRESLAAPKDVPVGQPFTAKVTLRPQDYVVKAGHRLVLAIAGSDVVWGVPDAVSGQRVEVLPDSVLRLPLGSSGNVLR
ncbi:MAG TPA: CocE/NonD family hydrolase [Frankiaceae bacterium]|jgi:X-Pro dipeptidyl-peptidase|nr:CocE/NonD family hydrolase [Frankiaceae bacterium]